jgi:hypothetical protein
MNIEELKTRKNDLINQSNATLDSMQKTINQSERVARVAQYSDRALAHLDAEFELQTKLQKKDFAFLFFATALQCLRQYLLTDFKPRVDHQTAADSVKKLDAVKDNRIPLLNKLHSDKIQTPYEATLEDVLNGPVPFDTIAGSKEAQANLSGFNHRQKTLGHDPVLGWIFGTANITTNTITLWEPGKSFPPLVSRHVVRGPVGTTRVSFQNKISEKASTALVLDHFKRKLMDEGNDGKKIFGIALVQEYIHLKSDVNSFKSLPLPIINGINPRLANTLASYGLDTANIINVGKQASYAILINSLIGMIHYLCYNKEKDGSTALYSVRTNRLITISNVLASVSNALIVLFNSMLGNEAAIRKLDIGGMLVTLHRLITDEILQEQIKAEFIQNNFVTLIRGE